MERPKPRQKTINPAGNPKVTDIEKLRKRILALEAERDQARADAERLAEVLDDVGRWLASEDAPLSVIQAIEQALAAYRKAHGEAARQEASE